MQITKRQCKAKSKRSQKQCNNPPIKGMEVCRMHGGSAPQAREAAARRVAHQQIQAAAEAVLAHEGITSVEDPLNELGKLASASTAMMNALGARVNSLQELEHFSTAAQFSPAIKAEVQMYERAMDRTHRLLDSLVKHGYAERQVTIAETEALLVAGVIRRVVAGLGLTPAQQEQAQTLLADEFRALEQQAVPRG
jgi:hypothetical protein